MGKLTLKQAESLLTEGILDEEVNKVIEKYTNGEKS